MTRFLLRFSVALGCLVLMSGCARTVIYVNPADTLVASDAYSFRTKPNAARVYIVSGKAGYGGPFDPDVSNAALRINGLEIGRLNGKDVMVVDLIPGSYIFSWEIPNEVGVKTHVTRAVNAGEIVILEANLRLSAMGIVLPILQRTTWGLTEITDRNKVLERRILLPLSCPTHYCR